MKGLSKQLEDHVVIHCGPELPPSDVLLELRPPPRHPPVPPWPPLCRFSLKTCRFKFRCRDCHARPRDACW